jgi:hypothetical protein
MRIPGLILSITFSGDARRPFLFIGKDLSWKRRLLRPYHGPVFHRNGLRQCLCHRDAHPMSRGARPLKIKGQFLGLIRCHFVHGLPAANQFTVSAFEDGDDHSARQAFEHLSFLRHRAPPLQMLAATRV